MYSDYNYVQMLRAYIHLSQQSDTFLSLTNTSHLKIVHHVLNPASVTFRVGISIFNPRFRAMSVVWDLGLKWEVPTPRCWTLHTTGVFPVLDLGRMRNLYIRPMLFIVA